jgi:hypothetical protein
MADTSDKKVGYSWLQLILLHEDIDREEKRVRMLIPIAIGSRDIL